MRVSKMLRTREDHQRDSKTQKKITNLSGVVKTNMKYKRWKKKKKMKPDPWITRKKGKESSSSQAKITPI